MSAIPTKYRPRVLSQLRIPAVMGSPSHYQQEVVPFGPQFLGMHLCIFVNVLTIVP
jgi:hypothetical protein